ncbi:MAG: phosphoadenosine phosphosulfate reductase family protein, partial [bacterium]|nr:phosphoadenosine phosphosulfate reductase family protein [bacterium]
TQLGKIRTVGKKTIFKHNPDLFNVEMVAPTIEDSFWVNLIGKGYPSPNRWFRWCTERLKIKPTSRYIKEMVNGTEEVIIVLGTRKAESANRAASMQKYSNGERLRKHRLPGTYVYAPIAELSNDEVWQYLMEEESPWGADNSDLLRLYSYACDEGECPFVIETGTPSCGKSRFGCWICTVVDRDLCMENYIENGREELQPLLDFRNWIYDIRQQNAQYVPDGYEETVKFSCFLLRTRQEMLDRLLDAQKAYRAGNGDAEYALITDDELKRVRGILKTELNGDPPGKMKEYFYRLKSGREMNVVSDFNFEYSTRMRMGPFGVRGIEMLGSKPLGDEYDISTRVMYWEKN